jgi:hypothetical protein
VWLIADFGISGTGKSSWSVQNNEAERAAGSSQGVIGAFSYQSSAKSKGKIHDFV